MLQVLVLTGLLQSFKWRTSLDPERTLLPLLIIQTPHLLLQTGARTPPEFVIVPATLLFLINLAAPLGVI